jgi:hypothetical protein
MLLESLWRTKAGQKALHAATTLEPEVLLLLLLLMLQRRAARTSAAQV